MQDSTETLAGAKRRLAVIKGQMTKLVTYVNEKVTRMTTIDELAVRLERAPALLKDFTATETVIFNLSATEVYDMLDFEENYYHVVASLNKYIRERSLDHPQINLNDSTIQTNSYAADVKLPKINIPPFAGDYTEWQSFSDLYNTTIHENSSLTPVHKFQYLKSFLRGEAANLLKHFNITDANYIEAFQKLRKRYDQKKHTVRKFIDMFFAINPVKRADKVNVREMVDVADEVIRGMKALGPVAESRDPWLIRILEEKLDEETRMLWARHSAEKDFPTLEDFFDFLQLRANSLESVKVDPLTVKFQSSKTRSSRNLHVSTKAICSVCKLEDHLLINCDKFKGMPVAQRRDCIRASNRCFNCLNLSHSSYYCKSKGRCPKCHKKHHAFLHIEPEEENTFIVTKSSQAPVPGTSSSA